MALSVNITEAVLVPAALGVKVTLRVHSAEGAREEPQVFVRLKSAELGPVSWILEKVNVALPTLSNVADCAALVVPTAWLENVTVVELMENPAVETGTTTLLPPPPQFVDHKARARLKVARRNLSPHSRLRTLISILGNSFSTSGTKVRLRFQ